MPKKIAERNAEWEKCRVTRDASNKKIPFGIWAKKQSDP
jgi:hypothetical protein